MTDRREVIEILNDLLSLERGSLISHLLASTVFVSRATAREDLVVRRMVREIDEHQRWLVDAIVGLRGGVAPGRPDPRVAELHYQDLRHVLPRVIRNEQRIVEQYEQALPRLGTWPKAAAVASRILARHREHLRELTLFLTSGASSAAGSVSAAK